MCNFDPAATSDLSCMLGGDPAALGVHGKRDIPYFTPAAQMRFPLYPAARVPRRRCTLYPAPGYGGDLLTAF